MSNNDQPGSDLQFTDMDFSSVGDEGRYQEPPEFSPESETHLDFDALQLEAGHAVGGDFAPFGETAPLQAGQASVRQGAVEMPHSDEEPVAAPKKKGVPVGLVAGVAAAGVAIIGGMAYLAFGMGGGNGAPQQARMPAEFSEVAQVQSSRQQPARQDLIDDEDLLAALDAPKAQRPSGQRIEANPVEFAPDAAVRLDEQEVVSTRVENGVRTLVSDGGSVAISDEQAAPAPARTQPDADAQQDLLSDEDAMYDKLLETASTMNVPTEAIRIDHTVIQQRLEKKRIETLEANVNSQREELGEVRSLVVGMKEQMAKISEAIDQNQKVQAATAKDLAAVSKAVERLATQQKDDVAKLRAELAAQAKAGSTPAPAVAKAPSPTPAPVQRPAPQPAVVPQQSVQQVASASVTPAVANIPAARPVVPVVAPASQSQAAQSCEGKPKSSVWRIKGINRNMAYIIRPEDNVGLTITLGSEVPGFGIAQSFDQIKRIACTSMGYIGK